MRRFISPTLVGTEKCASIHRLRVSYSMRCPHSCQLIKNRHCVHRRTQFTLSPLFIKWHSEQTVPAGAGTFVTTGRLLGGNLPHARFWIASGWGTTQEATPRFCVLSAIAIAPTVVVADLQSWVTRTTLAPVERHTSVTCTTSAKGNLPSAFTRSTFSLRFWKSCVSVFCREAQGTCSLLMFSVGHRCPEFSTCTTVASEPEGNGGPTNTSKPFGRTRVPGSDESRWAVSRFGASIPAVRTASRTFTTLAY